MFTTGNRHTCGVTRRGEGFCWGISDGSPNMDGGQVTALPEGKNWTLMSAGFAHTCGVT